MQGILLCEELQANGGWKVLFKIDWCDLIIFDFQNAGLITIWISKHAIEEIQAAQIVLSSFFNPQDEFLLAFRIDINKSIVAVLAYHQSLRRLSIGISDSNLSFKWSNVPHFALPSFSFGWLSILVSKWTIGLQLVKAHVSSLSSCQNLAFVQYEHCFNVVGLASEWRS